MKSTVGIIILCMLTVNSFSENSYEEKYTKAENGLILRTEPNVTSSKLDVIPINTLVKVIEYSKDFEAIDGHWNCWAKIIYNNKQGWVYDGYLFQKIESHVGVMIDSKKIGSSKYEYNFTIPGTVPGNIHVKIKSKESSIFLDKSKLKKYILLIKTMT